MTSANPITFDNMTKDEQDTYRDQAIRRFWSGSSHPVYGDRVGVSEIAKVIGVKRSRLDTWLTRGQADRIPFPVSTPRKGWYGGWTASRADVQAWQEAQAND